MNNHLSSGRAFVLFRGVAAALGATAAFTAADALAPTAAHGQQIRGRVVDEQTRSAVVEATVTLYVVADSARVDRVATATDGFFTVVATGPGEYRVVVERIGYAPVERRVTLGAQRELVVPAFVLESQAITLDSIQAEGRAGRDTARIAVGFRRSSHLVSGARLAQLDRMGVSVDAAVRELGAGLRVRPFHIADATRALTCVEMTRRMPSFRPERQSTTGCDMVTIVLDGVAIPDPFGFYQNLSLRDFESVEYVPAAEAGPLYGMEASANGALVLWTRGRGPHRSPERGGGG